MLKKIGVTGAALLMVSVLFVPQALGVQKVVVGEEYGATW